MILIDTSAWIESLRREGDAEIRDKVRSALVSGKARFAPFVLLELWNGARGDTEKKALRDLERTVPTLACDDDVWAEATNLARKARISGLTVPASDILIIATAMRHKATLLHCDSHFDAVAEIGV